MSAKLTTAADIIDVAGRMARAMETEEFCDELFEQLKDKGMAPAQICIDAIEVKQEQLYATWGFEGKQAVEAVHKAVTVHKTQAMRNAIVDIAGAEEKLAEKVARRVAKHNGIEIPDGPEDDGSHGHSHNGQPCNGSHGHSHGGGPQSQMQMQMMQMAMQSLTPPQRETMQRLQAKMMSGQQPNEEEKVEMMSIQRAIQTYMQTMGPMMQQMMQQGGPTGGINHTAPK